VTAPSPSELAIKSETGLPISSTSPSASAGTGGKNLDVENGGPNSAEPAPRIMADNPHGATRGGETIGWVKIPNEGRLQTDDEKSVDAGSGQAGSDVASDSTASRDVHMHAAQNAGVAPEYAQPRTERPRAPDPLAIEEQFTASSGSPPQRGARPNSGRVESIPHLVERGENFWTISRLYYNSGRYHRALWKANSAKYPDINVLHVGDTIVIPPLEDLDQTLIPAAPGRIPVSSAKAVRYASDNGGGADDAVDPARRTATRVSREEPTTVERRTPGSGTRLGDQPVYKVRPYDTLRSIARDTLGEPRRADEIMDLNRELIKDPSHLIAGQMLRLPEDARTSVSRRR
jgi:nucleoid-associated protein YgaU